MVTLKETSMKSSNIIAPKKTAGNNCAKCSEFGMKNIANAETIAPPKIINGNSTT